MEAKSLHPFFCLLERMIEVFNPKERPWIRMDGAATEKIIEQVKKCPSGALSYFLNAETPDESDKVVAESATLLKVEVTANGPYLIRSECLIGHSNGKEETKSGTEALCRCGTSQSKPYCDGSHKKIEFKRQF